MTQLDRATLFPEPELPDVRALIADGRALARSVRVGSCPFLTEYGVASEAEYKRQRMAAGLPMLHAQVGFRSLEKSKRAYGEIYHRLRAAGRRVDRYGICLDWSMGYPAARRASMPRGTGLILEHPEQFAELTACAPVAPHFGDFVIGTPAALENTVAALAAGATSIGNLGQYFTFRMPRWNDDAGTTAASIQALALCSAQPVEILIHSNLDDGFAALFRDMACALGAVLIERYAVEELIGGNIRVSHCYGHTFSDPVSRLAFLLALRRVSHVPGTMVYGNTTLYGPDAAENYASLASYLLVDILGQRLHPTGHALNPVPVTEALRIPEIDEIVAAHLAANRLIERAAGLAPLFDPAPAIALADRLVEGGERFFRRTLSGLAEAGIDTRNPLELLLAIRRVGARKLEALFGPGAPAEGDGPRRPVVRTDSLASIESEAGRIVAALPDRQRSAIATAGLVGCVACTDVHEYGKILVETTLQHLGVRVIDGGVSADPEAVARAALSGGAHFIAISTYSGVAWLYLRRLMDEQAESGRTIPVFAGGKLNEIPDESADSLPVDVSDHLRTLGVRTCVRVEDLLSALGALAGEG